MGAVVSRLCPTCPYLRPTRRHEKRTTELLPYLPYLQTNIIRSVYASINRKCCILGGTGRAPRGVQRLACLTCPTCPYLGAPASLSNRRAICAF